MRLFLLSCCIFFVLSGCSQQPEWRYIAHTKDHLLPLGDTTITARLAIYNDTLFPFFLHLHHNEATAENSIHRYVAANGGASLVLHNNRQRNLAFTLSGKHYVADPNRIFTPQGIRQSLRLLSTIGDDAVQELGNLAKQLTVLLPDSLPLVAVHNNTDGAYSLLSYTPNGELASDAARVHHNPAMDADDFVLTTDEALFTYLQRQNINAVLQANATAADDGSLSVVMGKSGRCYANIEAEHGHDQVQLLLIQLVAGFIQTPFHANR